MPPAGNPPPNGDDNISAFVIASAVSALAIATVAVAARFYTRAVIMRALAAEDWFVLIAWLHSIGYTVFMVIQAKSGLGRHIWTLQPEDLVTWGMVSWAALLFYQLSLACSKISILLLYLRVLTYKWLRRAAWALFAVIVIYSTLFVISTVTLCVPLEALWNPAVKGNCRRDPVYMWLAIGFHIATDFLVFALPLPVVILMTVALSHRIMLLLIFALGFLACVISVLRAILIRPLLRSADISWEFVTISHWTSVEVNTAIVCACLLATKPLIDLLWNKLRRVPRLPVGETSLGSGPLTIGSESVRGSKLPSGSERLERGYTSDAVVLSVTEAEDFELPMGDVGQQYAAAMKEVATVRRGKLDV